MKFEQTKAYGGADKFSLWYLGDHKLEYGEIFQITFSCQFDFSHFPFDSNECLMKYGSYEVAENKLTFKPPIVSHKNKMTKIGYDPIIRNSVEHQYRLNLGTIHILRKHIYRLFGPPPPYVRILLVLRISKNWHFLTPPPPLQVLT